MLLFRVVSTPGVGKIVALSVLFSAVPSRGGQHPHPLGVTPVTPPFASSERPRNPHLHIVNRVNEPC